MKLLNKLFIKLGFIPVEENKELLKKMISQVEEISKLKHELKKTKVDRETWYKASVETNTKNNNLSTENTELKAQIKELELSVLNQIARTHTAENYAKSIKRKNNVLLTKQGKWKGIIAQLEADKHNLEVKLNHSNYQQDKVLDELNLLKQELEDLGIYEPNNITELQAENQKLKKQNSLMAQLQIIHSNLIDTYKYGFAFSYLDSLKPRTVVELTKQDLKNGSTSN